MHCRAPAHFSLAVRDVLNKIYHDRCISYGGPTAWPPRSPDLNRLNVYLRRPVKTAVYASPVDNEEALHRRTVDACRTIRKYFSIFERTRLSMLRRVDAYAQSLGGHFDHLLKYTFPATTHKLNVSGHMFLWTITCFGMWNSCPKFACTFQLHLLYAVLVLSQPSNIWKWHILLGII
jgi:hypothetical protein